MLVAPLHQMDFPGEAATPAGMAAMDEQLPACSDPVLRCSCGDCPDAPQCEPVRCCISFHEVRTGTLIPHPRPRTILTAHDAKPRSWHIKETLKCQWRV